MDRVGSGEGPLTPCTPNPTRSNLNLNGMQPMYPVHMLFFTRDRNTVLPRKASLWAKKVRRLLRGDLKLKYEFAENHIFGSMRAALVILLYRDDHPPAPAKKSGLFEQTNSTCKS